MRWIGQNIFDLKTTFKDDVVIEKTIVTSGGTAIGTTDLTATTHVSQITINSSNGADLVVAEASGTIAGVMTVAHHDKLDGVETSATADQTKSDIDGLAITTVGTIDSGTWNGAAISNTYLSSVSGTNTGDQTTISGNAATATALATSRNFQADLASTSTAGFTGAASCTPGVTGTLAIGNGGTGATASTGWLNSNVTSVSGSSGSCTGTAAVATGVTVTAETSDQACYPTFAIDNTSGTKDLKSNTALSYNANSGILTSTHFRSEYATPTAPGANADAFTDVKVERFGREIITSIFLDLDDGAASTSSNGHIIQNGGGTTPAYLTRLTTAINGVVYRAEMICLEVPVDGQTNIDLGTNTDATLYSAHDVVSDGSNGVTIINQGTWVIGEVGHHLALYSTSFSQGDYVYLSCGASGTSDAYSAGKFLIKFYGAV